MGQVSGGAGVVCVSEIWLWGWKDGVALCDELESLRAFGGIGLLVAWSNSLNRRRDNSDACGIRDALDTRLSERCVDA